jgi:geranylgeranyl reductase family protein
MTNSDYDVIIIGGGPGGSTAGYLLSNHGLNVLIIDKEKFPRPKLCGGMLSLKTIFLLREIFNETPKSLERKGIFNYQTDHYEVTYKLERVLANKPSELPFYFTHRSVYDNFLLTKAKEAGATVLEGKKVESINLSTCEVFLPEGEKYTAKYIIGADGANSMVRQEFIRKGLVKKEQWQKNIATALECYIDRNQIDDDYYDHPVLLFGLVKSGYLWIFPNKERLVVGLGALNRKNKGSFVKVLQKLLTDLNFNYDPQPKIAGHPVPFGNYKINPLYRDKIILIGDAGGFVDPLMGEGIYYTQKSAEFAASAIYQHITKKKSIKSSYLKNLRKEIYPELRNVLFMRWFAFMKMNIVLKYYPVQYIIKSIETQFIELIQGLRSYKTFRKELDLDEILSS